MGKIKLNLVSGAVVEKPLINAFKANNNSYIVLDNEMNGSMGLPIILVCKFENNKLTKILDQNEWGIVKEYLKNIIAGNQIEFIKVDNELSADDIYYTQLTLPVPSFDALKSAYKIEEDTSSSNEVSIMDVVTPEVQTIEPITPEVTPVVEPSVAPVIDTPVVPQVESPIVNTEPVIDIPGTPVTLDVEVSTPEVNTEIVSPISPVDIVPPVNPEPEITPTPVIEPVVTEPTPIVETVDASINDESTDGSIFKEQKEAFMQACENMFDALVQKFERELENRK